MFTYRWSYNWNLLETWTMILLFVLILASQHLDTSSYVSWRSCILQNCKAIFSCYFWLGRGVHFFFWGDIKGYLVKSFISGLRVANSIFKPLRIYSGNSAAALLPKNNKIGNWSIHIDIKCLAWKEHVKANEALIERIRTELMIRDPLRKGMPPKLLKDLVVKSIFIVVNILTGFSMEVQNQRPLSWLMVGLFKLLSGMYSRLQ